MAERQGSTARTIQQNGEYGNGSVALLNDTLVGDAIADTVVLGSLPGGSSIFIATMINAALGASSTISLGYRYIDTADGSADLTAFHSAVAKASGARTEYAGAPVVIADGGGVEIVATVGGGAATGALDAVMEYVYNGV